MHIAAQKPVALSRDEVADELIDKERSIAEQKAAESGKPAEIVAKMVEGHGAEIPEGSHAARPAVRQGRQATSSSCSSREGRVNVFRLYVVGEGIEKKQSDFAAEVAAQVAAAR